MHQPDGKIVVAGGNTVARLLPNGALDASFGIQTIVKKFTLDPINVTAISVASNGNIVFAGGIAYYDYTYVGRITPQGLDMWWPLASLYLDMERPFSNLYLLDIPTSDEDDVVAVGVSPMGSGYGLVASFSGEDKIMPNYQSVLGPPRMWFDRVRISSDGKILAVSAFGVEGVGVVARLMPDLSLDPTFGKAGLRLLDFQGDQGNSSGVARLDIADDQFAFATRWIDGGNMIAKMHLDASDSIFADSFEVLPVIPCVN